MTNRELYDLADEEFALFVNSLGESLDKEKMHYILVGGTAVQMHLANRLCQKSGKDIVGLSKERRLQDYLRATDDVDLALSQQVYANTENDEIAYFRRVEKALEGVVQEAVSPSGEKIIEYKLARMGTKRPLFSVIVDGHQSDERRIMLNIGRESEDLRNVNPANYQEFVDAGQKISVPYNSSFSINARVIPITGLLATKVANSRAKDIMDLKNLCDLMQEGGESIDFEGISRILEPKNVPNFNKFLNLVDGPEELYK